MDSPVTYVQQSTHPRRKSVGFLSEVRQAMNGIHNAGSITPPDPKAKQAAWNSLQAKVKEWLKWRAQ